MGIMNVQANQSDGRESVMCTGVRFSDDEGNTYFGRNLDWSFSYGETILVTPRGYHYDTVFGAGGKAKPNAVIGVGVVMGCRCVQRCKRTSTGKISDNQPSRNDNKEILVACERWA